MPVIQSLTAAADAVQDFIREACRPSPADPMLPVVAFEPFGELACALFRFQATANPTIRELVRFLNLDPASVQDWAQIPAISTLAFKEQAVSVLPEGDRTVCFHSSGTTGHVPSRNHHNARSLSLYELSLEAGFHHAVSPLDPLPRRWLSLTPPAAAVPNSSLAHMLDQLGRSHPSLTETPVPECAGICGRDGAWNLDLNRSLMILNQAIRECEPLFVIGTAFNFVHLLDFLARAGRTYQLPAGSLVMETGGYKGRSREMARDELHGLLSRFLGLPATRILTEYGMCELSSQAYRFNTPANAGAFHFPPWVRVRVLDVETGRLATAGTPGILEIVDLANVASSVAIQTQDLARAVGSGFELLGRAPGAEERGCSLRSATTAPLPEG